jgi:large subunit ribosomal protein L21
MFAVIKTGGKQYRVAADETLEIGNLPGEAGEEVTFGEVLMLGGDQPKLGAPLVDGASVIGEIVEHRRGRKVIAFKKRRRHNSRRKRGHRQHFTLVRITDILTEPGKERAAKKAAAADEAGAAKKPRTRAPKKAETAAESSGE